MTEGANGGKEAASPEARGKKKGLFARFRKDQPDSAGTAEKAPDPQREQSSAAPSEESAKPVAAPSTQGEQKPEPPSMDADGHSPAVSHEPRPAESSQAAGGDAADESRFARLKRAFSRADKGDKKSGDGADAAGTTLDKSPATAPGTRVTPETDPARTSGDGGVEQSGSHGAVAGTVSPSTAAEAPATDAVDKASAGGDAPAAGDDARPTPPRTAPKPTATPDSSGGHVPPAPSAGETTPVDPGAVEPAAAQPVEPAPVEPIERVALDTRDTATDVNVTVGDGLPPAGVVSTETSSGTEPSPGTEPPPVTPAPAGPDPAEPRPASASDAGAAGVPQAMVARGEEGGQPAPSAVREELAPRDVLADKPGDTVPPQTAAPGDGAVEEEKAAVGEPIADAPPSVAAPAATPSEAPPVVPVAREQEKPKQRFGRIKQALARTRKGLGRVFLGKKQIDDELLEDLETHLLTADLGFEVTTEVIEALTDRVKRKELNDTDALQEALRNLLVEILKPCEVPLDVTRGAPFVLMTVGVNGVGKTTTIGKLAKQYLGENKSVMLAAGDTFRAAAVEQLQVWGERNGVPVVAQHTGADSASVIYDAFESARARSTDVLIADTAGRLHTKSNLMDELKKIKRVVGRLEPAAPHEVLLVLDAGTGQNAVTQLKQFHEAVGVTGIALTKLDGTAKGGVIFALCRQFGIPVRYIGVGESVDDLQPFRAEDFVDALLAQDSGADAAQESLAG